MRARRLLLLLRGGGARERKRVEQCCIINLQFKRDERPTRRFAYVKVRNTPTTPPVWIDWWVSRFRRVYKDRLVDSMLAALLVEVHADSRESPSANAGHIRVIYFNVDLACVQIEHDRKSAIVSAGDAARAHPFAALWCIEDRRIRKMAMGAFIFELTLTVKRYYACQCMRARLAGYNL